MRLDWVLRDDDKEYASGSIFILSTNGKEKRDPDNICAQVEYSFRDKSRQSINAYIREALQ